MRELKKEYTSPECSVVQFDSEDIITTSTLASYNADQNSTTGDFDFGWFTD